MLVQNLTYEFLWCMMSTYAMWCLPWCYNSNKPTRTNWTFVVATVNLSTLWCMSNCFRYSIVIRWVSHKWIWVSIDINHLAFPIRLRSPLSFAFLQNYIKSQNVVGNIIWNLSQYSVFPSFYRIDKYVRKKTNNGTQNFSLPVLLFPKQLVFDKILKSKSWNVVHLVSQKVEHFFNKNRIISYVWKKKNLVQ